MQEYDIINRIEQLCKARSWTYYRLAKESGITYSTLCTMLHKSNAPSVPTLLKLCKGFGITVGQFFDENNEIAMLTEAQKQHLALWKQIEPAEQTAIDRYLRYLIAEQGSADAE